MKRYQVYYEPTTMDYLTEISQQAGVSRSRLLQDMAEVFASRYFLLIDQAAPKINTLLDLAGIVKSKGKKTTYTSIKPDSDYFGV